MRQAEDFKLAGLFKELSGETFTTALLDASMPAMQVIEQRIQPLKHVALNTRVFKFYVQLCLAGKQYVIATFDNTNTGMQSAARLADMAQYFFRAYRLRGGIRYNFSQAQAVADIESEAKITTLFELIFARMKDTDRLIVPNQETRKSPVSLRAQIARLERKVDYFIGRFYGKVDIQ